MTQLETLREALSRVEEILRTAIVTGDDSHAHEHDQGNGHDREQEGDRGDGCVHVPAGGNEQEEVVEVARPGCVVRSLPERLLVKAAVTARAVNPVNAPAFEPHAAMADGPEGDMRMRLAVLTTKYWGPQIRRMTVSFMETTPSDLRARIVRHMNAWSACCGISFVETGGTGDVRISRGGGGYWSYLGTDILHIPKNRPTMNLQSFTMSTSDAEFKRVVRHETGHTLGFPHEHMRKTLIDRIDRAKAYAWFLRQYGWDKATVDTQVLTPLSEAQLMGTPADQTSIMCYQLPGAITKDGRPIVGGGDINATDCSFAGKIYPRPGRSVVVGAEDAFEMAPPSQQDWPASEDPEVHV